MDPHHLGNIPLVPAGQGTGGNHPYTFAPPIPEWALVLLADPQVSPAQDATAVKEALYEYLKEIGEIDIQYAQAIQSADIAAMKARYEAEQRFRKKIL
jgi:hypothetical protein